MSTDTPLGDASPPDRHGYRCAVAVCLRLIVTAVEGLFATPPSGPRLDFAPPPADRLLSAVDGREQLEAPPFSSPVDAGAS